MITKYDLGDYIFVAMKVSKIEIMGDRVYYRVAGGKDIKGDDVLIPEDKITCGFSVKKAGERIRGLYGSLFYCQRVAQTRNNTQYGGTTWKL